MDVSTLHRRTVEGWADRVRAVEPDQWERPTPCADWSVRDLVNHVTGEDLWTVPLNEGQTVAEVGDRFAGDLLGGEPVETALAAARAAVASVTARLPEGGTVNLSFGDTPVEEYVLQLAADHLVHGWDLAAATGGDTSLDPELVDAIGAWFGDREESYRGAGAIGPAVGLNGDAQHDLLARFGRDDAWRATG